MTFPSGGRLLEGVLFTPDENPGERRPSVVVAQAFTGEAHGASRYAERLTRRGFAVLAFDAAHQGAARPHLPDEPFRRAEDIRSAVSFLTDHAEVDPGRIGALGLGAAGVYILCTARTDDRIRAVATVSAVGVADLLRDRGIRLLPPRPLLMIAGTDADTAHFSVAVIKQAEEPKELLWIGGATHTDLYDTDLFLTPAASQLAGFFTANLPAQASPGGPELPSPHRHHTRLFAQRTELFLS
ncbi:alpha/beta hydrolase [Streptomyces sp. NPDC004436]